MINMRYTSIDKLVLVYQDSDGALHDQPGDDHHRRRHDSRSSQSSPYAAGAWQRFGVGPAASRRVCETIHEPGAFLIARGNVGTCWGAISWTTNDSMR